ncbi:unnamed protein product [Bemisia tabaci]|uniref:Uncharacterized protein n=3 Tax=Bemisia tabaci TaxID=7038 RepID=A0A9P0EYN1_BEMTA|nr:PREDICTED: uncharacterized protein LOC109033602 isoform X2 [Bemisia tabaci]XP_018901835.1 PREDICTED: uncharacterized protein LOC109033602 isoform X2 [Bemisia tabaci]XP_018901836.1 PREDICTED: uncharacterized protein LOC109033602 isoform X2 [Bemisia tabaci]CAH0381335.1 unnamed protein product [Bemisia tabaci]
MDTWSHVMWLAALMATLDIRTTRTDPREASQAQSHSQMHSYSQSSSHSRQKRLLWITNDGRLALPPGTHLTITPSLSLPFVRYPPEGFLSNMSISLPFTIDFDSLGLTDNQNPYGVLPPLLGRSMGREAGSILANYIAHLLNHKKAKRSLPLPEKPPEVKHLGGERALLYTIVEDLLSNFGMDGRACLLRAICEVHAHSYLHRFGLIGEILKLFFTASKSPFSDLMGEYVAAERAGLGGECWPYFKECTKSLFLSSAYSKYSTSNENEQPEEEENDIIDERVYKVDLNQKPTLTMSM